MSSLTDKPTVAQLATARMWFKQSRWRVAAIHDELRPRWAPPNRLVILNDQEYVVVRRSLDGSTLYARCSRFDASRWQRLLRHGNRFELDPEWEYYFNSYRVVERRLAA